VKQAGFLVLYKTTMPSILIELGFVTNDEEGAFLGNNQNLDKLASGVFNAFSEYKKEVDGRSLLMSQSSSKSSVSPAEEQGIHFRVQLASSKKAIDIKPSNFKGVEGVEQLQVDGGYKYTVGRFTTFEDGLVKQREIREKAYKDAFLIAIQNGERIPISEALEKLKTP
jgi:N-acetylmuramoyl-L-alanine amidase